MTVDDSPVPQIGEDGIAAVLDRAKQLGFEGWSGACGKAAIAINRVVFGGEGKIVGAFNEAFLSRGRMIGHVAVLVDGSYWDADGYPKDLDDIDSWGMLDPDDRDHVEEAERLGFAWDDHAAYGVRMVEFGDEAELIRHFMDDNLEEQVEILRQALRDHSAEAVPSAP